MENSLLWREEAADEARFRMLETIREYAHDHLRQDGDEEELARRHAEHYLVVGQRARQALDSEHQLSALAELDRSAAHPSPASRRVSATDTRRDAAGFAAGWEVGLLMTFGQALEYALGATVVRREQSERS